MKLGEVKGVFINIESSTINGLGRITPVPFVIGIHGKFFRDIRIKLRPDKFARLGIIFFFPDIIPFEPSLHVSLRNPSFVPNFIALSFQLLFSGAPRGKKITVFKIVKPFDRLKLFCIRLFLFFPTYCSELEIRKHDQKKSKNPKPDPKSELVNLLHINFNFRFSHDNSHF